MRQTNLQNQDFKPRTSNKKQSKFKLNRLHVFALAVSVSIPTLLIAAISDKAQAVIEIEQPKTQAAAISDSQTNRIVSHLNLPTNKVAIETAHAVPINAPKTQSVTVKNGDTLTHIFRRVGLGAKQVYQITQLDKKTRNLSRLNPGQTFDFEVSEKTLNKLTYHIDKTHKIIIQKNNGTFEITKENREYEARVTYVKGDISTSLFEAAHDAGLSDNLTMELAHIFGWDIDFALDIRKGDKFVVMYEELYLDGERARDGNILAAEFTNQGKSFKTVRYTDAKNNSNFYSPDGKSMRKAFLRSPVDFTRISSRFGKRYHPTLKKRKSHKGVDYAASRGTPIKAAGDGKIIWRARKGGYGKTVMIKHGTRYTTLYAHMKSYNRKAKRGSHVKQGQVIGYVGTTGRSTGPHLHYEFRVNGTHRNPLTVKLPNAASIKKEYLSDFFSKSRPLMARLDIVKNTNVALSDF